MMNIWNGTGVDSWLNRYNGVAPLTAQYDWISYTKPSAGPAEPSVPSEPSAPSSDGQFDSNQLYMLRSKNSGKALDLYWGSPDNGYYVIENYASGKALDVSGISSEDNANIIQWDYSGQANQLWEIIPV